MDLSIVIPFYNGDSPTLDKLLYNLNDLQLSVIVVDDLSERPYDGELHNAKLLNLNKKRYFSGAVNEGIKSCANDVLVLNQDVSFTPASTQWLDLLEQQRGKYAMIGESIKGEHPGWRHGYIRGTFMFMRRDAIDKVGLLDELHFPHWGSTCDWQCRIARKGFRALPLQNIPGWAHLASRGQSFGGSTTEYLRKNRAQFKKLILTPPIISVIIPSFNHGKYLESAVNSLIGGPTDLGDMPGQTFQGFEIIIIDDASTDLESRKIAASLADGWKGIKFIQRKTNGGTGTANNSGISIATGKFITIMCGDDMMESHRLERMLREIRQDETRVIYDDLQLFRHGERVDFEHNGQIFPSMKMKEYDFNKLLYKNHMHCGILFARSAWEIIGGYPEAARYGREDWAMNIALGINGYCGIHINEAMYLYRREDQNRTKTNTTLAWRKFFLTQMQQLFPRTYAKERAIMSCNGCGGRGKTPKKISAKALSSKALTEIQGVEGMILLEYVGKSIGTQTWYGPATGKQYRFGLSSHKIQPVDPDDIQTGSNRKPGFLEIRESGRRVFKIVKPKVSIPKASEVPHAAEKVAFSEGESIDVDNLDIEIDDFDAEQDAFRAATLVGQEINISPAAKKLAQKMDVTTNDIVIYVTGTGRDGKITVKDIREYANA